MKYYSLPLIVCSLLIVGCGKPVAGPEGSRGPAGSNGSDGATGSQGPQGAQGNPGVDATSVTIVQFCSSCVPSYPSVFSEIGFCIDGNIYATYSANGGFSAKMPPGSYSSNGIGCSCTFTIQPNCVVN